MQHHPYVAVNTVCRFRERNRSRIGQPKFNSDRVHHDSDPSYSYFDRNQKPNISVTYSIN